MQDEAEPVAFAGRKRKAAHCREIGLFVRKLGHHRAHRTTFERFLHRPCIARSRHAQDDEARHRQAHEIEPRPIEEARLGGGEIRLDPHHAGPLPLPLSPGCAG